MKKFLFYFMLLIPFLTQAQWKDEPKIEVEGYGTVIIDNEFARFFDEKLSYFKISNDFRREICSECPENMETYYEMSYVYEVVKNGKISKIDVGGRFYCQQDESTAFLYDKKADNRHFWGRDGTNYHRKQALYILNDWIKEYAKEKIRGRVY